MPRQSMSSGSERRSRGRAESSATRLEINELFDQSVFVTNSVNGVLQEAR